jgi:hypothetical protein
MKKSIIYAGIAIMAVLPAGSLQAQSSISKVLDAFTKTAKDNPNDTSSADLTMKALGNLAGGGGVSAADSVAAVKSFTTAKGGNGVFYQYITTIVTKQGTNNDTSATYFTTGGEGRKEMNLPGMMGVKGRNSMTLLAHASQPQYSLTIDAGNKTYSLNVIDTSLINSGISSYKATKIGSETVQGYNCMHARLVSTTGSGMFKSTSTTDVWTSTDVPGYSIYKAGMAIHNSTPAMIRALEQVGCGGFLVRMAIQGKDYSSNMVLVKAQQKSFPASLFQVPAGYTEVKQNIFSHMMETKK